MEPTRIDSSGWNKKEDRMPLRKILVKAAIDGNFIFYQDIINCVISWVNLIIYIYYLNNFEEIRLSTWYKWFQYSVHTYFILDFSFRILCWKYPRVMISQFCNILEMLTTVPFFVALIFGQGDLDNYYFRLCIMLDTVRVYLTKRVIDGTTSDNFRDILHIGNIMLLIIIFPAAFCSFVESTYPTDPDYDQFSRTDTTYGQMVYYIFISMTFIGYGTQVFTDVGKVFMTFFLMTAFAVLPT